MRKLTKKLVFMRFAALDHTLNFKGCDGCRENINQDGKAIKAEVAE